MDEDEKLFIEFIKENYRLCTDKELEGWKEEYILKMLRLNKLHPLATIVMGRKGPVIVIPKEESEE